MLIDSSMSRNHVSSQSPRRPAESQQCHRRWQVLLDPRNCLVNRLKFCVIDIRPEAFQRGRILHRIKLRTTTLLERHALTQGVWAPRECRKTESPHQNRSDGSAATSPPQPVQDRSKDRESFSAFARIARYSGRYLPACRISQIGGIGSRLPARTLSRGLLFENCHHAPILTQIKSIRICCSC